MMMRRIVLWTVLGLIAAAGIAYAFWPRPVPVDLLTMAKSHFVVSIEEEGETRVRDVFKLSAPVTGRSQRISLEVGDHVEANKTVVTRIEPIDPSILDVRSQVRAVAEVRAAEAARVHAGAELERARVGLKYARIELERSRSLKKNNTISQLTVDKAEENFKTQIAAVKVAEAALKMRDFDLERARAQLISPQEAVSQRQTRQFLPIRSPVSGKILQIFQKSEGVVQAGGALVEIGDPRDLEIEVDLLSSDAVRVEKGQRVEISNWGGVGDLKGVVKRTEPFGYKKVSALGIEEQRVNVIVGLTSKPESWKRLGHGYQLDAKIIVWEGEVLSLPLTALFRKGERWAVFVAENDTAHLRYVEVGQRNGLRAEITSGLKAGEKVVSHPGDRVAEGVRLELRQALSGTGN